MIRICLGLLLTALITLMVELTLIRVFDVVWYPNMAYMVITLAMFSFGLAGIYSTLRPRPEGEDPAAHLARLSFGFALFVVLILPLMNLMPFDFNLLHEKPVKGVLMFLVMYLALAIPFFLSGLIFTTVFSAYAGRIQALYFWDLAGAALGCIALVPFLPVIGPGGILFLAAAAGMIACALFAGGRVVSLTCGATALALTALAYLLPASMLDFREHIDKRGVKQAREEGAVEFSRWDPISKIDVINQEKAGRKHVAYDGGTQSTFIFPFDGDYQTLRENLDERTNKAFTGQNVYISHWIKRDSNQKVLVIGAAGGQEIKAALMFGAGQVDAVELVDLVVRLGKQDYAQYNGDVFNHPRVKAITGEGRSFLRASNELYDIIQIYSNHTSSSIAAGTGAMAPGYLQTAEAYEEYFRHLAPEGLLHINHHIYPRMVTTAALAWKRMGRGDFRRHVLIFEAKGAVQDNLPTMLIKQTPWTAAEVDNLRDFFGKGIAMVEDPIHPRQGFLSDEFYSGDFPAALAAKSAYRVDPTTDNRPFFNFLRKKIKKLREDRPNFLNYSTAALLNSQLKTAYFPRDVIHLIVTGIASLFFAAIFIGLPLFFSEAGRARWPRKHSVLVYFGCLGAGFIILELVFIQLFMKLVGYPLYTYSTVVFALLLAAGLGSWASGRLRIGLEHRWWWPFAGILGYGALLLIGHAAVFEAFLTSPIWVRIGVAMAMILPLGFFLGMPFPLGILALVGQPRGAIAWAWGLNGLFTVIGGFLSVILSLFWGFRVAILLALAIYALALLTFRAVRTMGSSEAASAPA